MKRFEKQLGYIQSETIRTNTEKVLSAVNEKFFTAPASSSGKYHPSYALGEGGLVRHTVAACEIAHDILSRECMRGEFTQDEADYIIAALILHDTCKSGINWESETTSHEHPLLVGELILSVLGKGEYYCHVYYLVATHMGEWVTSKYSPTVLPKPTSRAQEIVHLCDYLASRKYLEFKFDCI